MSIRMKHEAIKALDSNVYYVIQSGETFVAYDTNDSVVEFDNSAVNTKAAELQTAKDLENLREERNAKLAETDWTQSRDVTLSNDSAWATYRQALRDITDSATSLDDVTWPTKPSE